jgi:hypothetical protein
VAYPWLIGKVPRITELAADRFLSHFGNLSVREMVDAVLEHAKAKGLHVDARLRDQP